MEKIIKVLNAFTAVVLGVYTSRYGMQIAVGTCLIASMVLDWITGCASAKINEGGLSSKAAIKGGIKKLMYIAAVGIGIIVDTLLHYGLVSAEIKLSFSLPFTMIIMLYLVFTELVSLIENLTEMGLKLPGFILSIVQKAKDEIDKGNK